jgi:hypothetical protein
VRRIESRVLVTCENHSDELECPRFAGMKVPIRGRDLPRGANDDRCQGQTSQRPKHLRNRLGAVSLLKLSNAIVEGSANLVPRN